MLWVYVAGGVRAEIDGTPVPDNALGGRQGRKLLARLACEGRSVHRDELADGIWVDTLPRTWERTLSGVVTRLRVGLAGAGAPPKLVTFSNGRYALDPVAFRLDVAVAAADLDRGRVALDGGAGAEAVTLANAVLAVARLPLMPGDDATWVDFERARHRSLLLDALDLLVDASAACGSYADAEGAAREAIHWDPIREAGYQRLMLVLAQAGDRAAALEAYHACRRTLADELGVDPSSATESLLSDLVGAEALPPRHRGGAHGASGGPIMPPAVVARVGPMVGREAELVHLWATWRRARVDAPLVAWVHGPTGNGVRTLIAAFAREVHAAGALVVRRSGDVPDSADVVPVGRAILELAQHDGGGAPVPSPGTSLLLVEARVPPVAPGPMELAVPPLDRAAVAELAERRLGGIVAPSEVDELLTSTGGRPSLLVANLDRMAQLRAEVLAERAADTGHAYVLAHDALVDELIRRPAAAPDLGWGPSVVPYKGLVRFEPEDADLFFGREHLVARVLAKLAAGGVVTVLGASGSGKSSMVRAGVVARLRRGALPGSERWPVLVVRPGVDPVTTLARCVDALAHDPIQSGVLVVDQLEELFTLGASVADRARFMEALAQWRTGDSHRQMVVVVRSDYLDACTALPGWPALFGGTEVVVGTPSDHDLRRIVSLPCRAFGTTIEPDLVELVVREAGGAAGALPLVSTALLGAWHARTDELMSVRAYVAAGGVGGAIAQLAEQVWEGLGDVEQRQAKSMFLRLAGGPVDDVSTPVPFEELDAASPDVVRSFLSGRLLTVDGDRVQVAHEALLREWPRLRGWLTTDRNEREVLAHLRHASTAWEAGGRDAADLYRGNRLAGALALVGDVDLTAGEREFLAAGTTAGRAELTTLRKRSARLKALSSALVVFLVVAIVAAGAAVVGRREATNRERIAVAQGLVVDALSAGSLDLGLLLAAEARRLDDSTEARGALLDLLNGAGAVERFLRGAPAHLSVVTVDPTGRSVAAGAIDGSVSVWQLDAETPSVYPVVDGPVTAMAFAPNGDLAVASGSGELVRWRAEQEPGDPVNAHAGEVLAVAYRSDGELVTVGADDLMRRFVPVDGSDGVRATATTTVPVGATATFAAAGATLALIDEDGAVRVLAVDSGRTTHDLHPGGITTAVALSADGRTLATGDVDGDVLVHDLVDGAEVRLGNLVSAEGVDGVAAVRSLAITPSGDVLATSGQSLALFETTSARGRPPSRIAGSAIRDVAVAASGDTAVAVTDDGEAIVLALGRSLLGRPLANTGGPVTALRVMDSGAVLAGGTDRVVVIDASSDAATTLAVPGRPVTALSVADGQPSIAVGGRDVFSGGGGPHGTTVVIAHDGVVAYSSESAAAVTAVAWIDAVNLAVGTEGGSVQLVDTVESRTIRQIPGDGAVIALGVRGDRSELVGLSASGTLSRWSVTGDRTAPSIDLGPSASALAFAPDGRTVAVATPSGIMLVDLDTGRSERLTDAAGALRSMAFGLGGAVLAAADDSGVVGLWDVALRRRLGTPLPLTGSALVAFDATGNHLVTGGVDGEVAVWDISPDELSRRACEMAGRALTREEWARYLPRREYDPACT